jgi:hypothetical protein
LAAINSAARCFLYFEEISSLLALINSAAFLYVLFGLTPIDDSASLHVAAFVVLK